MNNLTVDLRQLTQELAWVTKTSRSRYGVAALTTVHLSALVGAVRLRRTDMETYAETSVHADGGGQAAILVDPNKLSAILKGVFAQRAREASLHIGDTELGITLGGRTVTLRAAAKLDDYPDWPVFVEGGTSAILNPDELARALTSVSDDSSIQGLTGVLFEDMVMVSTDRFRMTRINYTGSGKPLAALLPAEALRAFTRGDDLVTIDHGKLGTDGKEGGMAQLVSGRRSVISHVLDAQFPKWRQHIPDAEAVTIRAVIRRDQLLAAVGPDDHDVTITITGPDGDTPARMLVVDADRDGDMKVEQYVPLVRVLCLDGAPFTVRMRAQYLKGCLKGCPGSLVFEATQPGKPVVLRAVGDNELHLIMPIRIPA